MITAKQLYNTYPHRQMRMYIEAQYPLDTPAQQAAKLGALVKKFLFNFEFADGFHQEQENLDVVPESITAAFEWETTAEGHHFWYRIHEYKPAPQEVPAVIVGPGPLEDLIGKPAKVKLPKAVKAAPKKRVGWWV